MHLRIKSVVYKYVVFKFLITLIIFFSKEVSRKKMPKSRNDKRQTSPMSIKKNSPCNRKIRKPLKCKINIIHANESNKKSLKKNVCEEKTTKCRTNEKSSPKKGLYSCPLSSLTQENILISGKNMLKSVDPKFKSVGSIEIDVLGNFTHSNENISSRLRHSNEIQIVDIRKANKNVSKCKYERDKKYSNRLSVISPFSFNGSPLRNKRNSFYRQSNLATQNPRKKMSLNSIDSKMVTPNRGRTRSSSAKKVNRTSNDLLSNGLAIKSIRRSMLKSKSPLIEHAKRCQSLPSKLEEASFQKNNKQVSFLRHIKKPKTNINDKLPKTVELPTNEGSSRSSMTLRTRHSSEKASEINSVPCSIQKCDAMDKTPKTIRLKSSLSKSSCMTFQNTNIKLRSSEKSHRNRISLRTRHHSEKVSNNLPSHETYPLVNREQIKCKKTGISKEQKKRKVKNLKIANKSIPSSNQEAEILLHKHKRSDSFPIYAVKSKNDKCFDDKDYHTPEMISSKSLIVTRSSQIKSLTSTPGISKKEKSRGQRIRKCCLILTDVMKESQTKKSAVLSKKRKAEVKDKKKPRKRLLSPPLKTETPVQKKRKLLVRSKTETPIQKKRKLSKRLQTRTPIQKKRKSLMRFIKTKTPIDKKRRLSVRFEKNTRSKSFSAIVPIDSLALTPTIVRKTKSDSFKFPGKNTLKRKRYVLNEIRKADDGYEDDIYESRTFDHFKHMFPDSSDSSELSCPIKTPKLASLLTPDIRCKTPAYKDCFNLADYALNRKIAEECIYRSKRKKRTSQAETPVIPEKKKLEFNKVVEKACAAQKEVEKLTDDPSDDEDSYFTDDS